jgi:hypothetical protein
MKITEHLFNIAKGAFTFNGIKTFADGLKTQGQNLTPYGKNYIINGGFAIAQRGFSQTTYGYGSVDRFLADSDGAGGAFTMSQLTTSLSDGSIDYFQSIYHLRYARTTATTGATYDGIFHKIENLKQFSGKTLTLSFKARAITTGFNLVTSVNQNFGVGGSPSATVSFGAATHALTTTWKTFTVTVSSPSIANKVVGSEGGHYLALNILIPANSLATFDIAEVKLEEGSVATPWTPYQGEFGGEIQACQRYYEIGRTLLDIPPHSAGVAVGAATTFKTTKRVTPTITLGTASESVNFTGINTSIIDTFGFRLTGTSITSGNLYYTNTFTASAEL